MELNSSDRQAHDTLRKLLSRGDLEGFLDVVAVHFPGTAGDRTRRTNVEGVRVFLRWAQEHLRSVMSADDLVARDYHDFLQHKHGDASTSVANRLTHVRNLYKALVQLGAVERNPFDAVRQANPTRLERLETFGAQEIESLLEHADVEARALVLIGAHAGLATREVLAVTWRDVLLDRGWLEVRGRIVPLSREALRALEALAARNGHGSLLPAEGRVFDIESDHALRARLYKLCRAANVPYRPWRALRNTAADKLLGETASTRRTAKRLGLTGTPRRNVRKRDA